MQKKIERCPFPDSNAESIFIPHHDECAMSRECKFTRALNISAENLQGHYVDEPSYSEENYVYKYDESSWFSESFFLWDDRKEYEFWKDNAEFELINGSFSRRIGMIRDSI